MKYSQKEGGDRESNNGLLKAMGGLGASLSPLLAALAITYLDFWLVYLTLAALVGIFTPLIYVKLKSSSEIFQEEIDRISNSSRHSEKDEPENEQLINR